MKSILLLVVCVICSSSLWAESKAEFEADLKKFAAAVQEQIAKKPLAEDGSQPGTPVEVILAQLNSKESNFLGVNQALALLRPHLEEDALRKQCDGLAVRYLALRDQERKDADEVLQRAIVAVRTAKTSKDLDACLTELTRMNDAASFDRVSSAAMIPRTQRATQFVENWQSYLSAVEADDGAHASEILDRLAQQGWPEAIPRSEILELRWKGPKKDAPTPTPMPVPTPNPDPVASPAPTAPPVTATSILQMIKTPEDLAAASAALESLSLESRLTSGSSEYSEVAAVKQTVGELDASYRAFKAGLATEIGLVRDTRNQGQPLLNLLVPVRGQLLSLVLPRYLHLPEGTKAGPGEGPIAYLERISREARDGGDYLLLSRAQDALQLLRNSGNGVWDGTTSASVFLVAVNQEEGGQYALAVTNYEKALGSSNPIVPPKVIGARLAALKAAHPDEFQQGLQDYLSPPEARYMPGMGRSMGPFGPGNRFAERPTPTKPPALAVPAAPALPSPPIVPKP